MSSIRRPVGGTYFLYMNEYDLSISVHGRGGGGGWNTIPVLVSDFLTKHTLYCWTRLLRKCCLGVNRYGYKKRQTLIFTGWTRGACSKGSGRHKKGDYGDLREAEWERPGVSSTCSFRCSSSWREFSFNRFSYYCVPYSVECGKCVISCTSSWTLEPMVRRNQPTCVLLRCENVGRARKRSRNRTSRSHKVCCSWSISHQDKEGTKAAMWRSSLLASFLMMCTFPLFLCSGWCAVHIFSRPECRHLMSIQQPTSSKTDLKVIMCRFSPLTEPVLRIAWASCDGGGLYCVVVVVVDRQSSSGSNVFGTLPRRDKERLDVHRPLQQNLSISYPNLSDIEDNFVKKCGTLQRKDAIRKKRPALYQHDDNERPAPPFYDPDGWLVSCATRFVRRNAF